MLMRLSSIPFFVISSMISYHKALLNAFFTSGIIITHNGRWACENKTNSLVILTICLVCLPSLNRNCHCDRSPVHINSCLSLANSGCSYSFSATSGSKRGRKYDVFSKSLLGFSRKTNMILEQYKF